MKRLAEAYRVWKVRQYEHKRVTSFHLQKSVALGFAWRAENIGGVRRHLECIEKYSSHPIALYPSTYASKLLGNDVEKGVYQRGLSDKLINQHALFHSHVDPNFIKLSRLAQQHGKPWVHTYHSLYFPEDWGDQLAPWQEEINDCLINEARQANVCLSVGSWLVDWLKTTHGIESQYLPNGVDIGACDRSQADRFTREYGFENFVLFVNSIAYIKNPLAFIEAARRFPERTFVMIGTGLTKAGIEKTFEIDIPSNLKPLGPLQHEQTLDAIAACSTFVMTSHREGLPTVLLEAMAMNKPCVVPDAPWFADAIQSEKHGFRYEPGDQDDLAEKITTTIDHGPLATAREHVEENFSWPVVTHQLDKIYSDLLG